MKLIRFWMVLFALTMTMVCSAQAHDYWIMPEAFQPAKPGVIEAEFTASHTCFESQEIPDITKFRTALLTPDNREVPLACSAVKPEAARFSVPLAGPGTYVLSAASAVDSYWCQTRDGWKTGRKSEHKDALKAGRYVKSIKSFVTLGRPTDSYKMALGHTIEIIPAKNPSVLKAGQELPVQILFQGRPLAGVEVYGVYEGYKAKNHDTRPVKTQTASNGVARIKIDRPGKWLIYAKHEVDTPGDPHADYANYRPYMLFEVN